MSLAVPTLFMRSLQAAGASIATKAPGSLARMNDVRNADPTLKSNTIQGELFTLAQVGCYGGLISAGTSYFAYRLKDNAPKLAQLLDKGSWLNVAIAVLASGGAEVVSRQWFNRKIDDNHHVTLSAHVASLGARRDDDDDRAEPEDRKKLQLQGNPFIGSVNGSKFNRADAEPAFARGSQYQPSVAYAVSPLALAYPAVHHSGFWV